MNQENCDLILAHAFQLGMQGDPAAVKDIVRQGLMLQYCSLLGQSTIILR